MQMHAERLRCESPSRARPPPRSLCGAGALDADRPGQAGDERDGQCHLLPPL